MLFFFISMCDLLTFRAIHPLYLLVALYRFLKIIHFCCCCNFSLTKSTNVTKATINGMIDSIKIENYLYKVDFVASA